MKPEGAVILFQLSITTRWSPINLKIQLDNVLITLIYYLTDVVWLQIILTIQPGPGDQLIIKTCCLFLRPDLKNQGWPCGLWELPLGSGTASPCWQHGFYGKLSSTFLKFTCTRWPTITNVDYSRRSKGLQVPFFVIYIFNILFFLIILLCLIDYIFYLPLF